jgi:hypothetical protein
MHADVQRVLCFRCAQRSGVVVFKQTLIYSLLLRCRCCCPVDVNADADALQLYSACFAVHWVLVWL